MKRVYFIFALIGLTLASSSCVENSAKYKALQAKLDSLQVNFGYQSGELDEAFATLNEVEQGLKSIRESENILAMRSQQGLEVPEGSRGQMKDDVAAIAQAIKQYQSDISKLRKDNKIQSEQFKKRLSAIQSELKQKMELVTLLTSQLEEKDAIINVKSQQISSLDQIVSNLKSEVSNLHSEGSALKEKVSNQEKELYSVYYIVGSKDELIEAGVLTKGGLFKSSKISYQSEKDAFVKIDYREINIINTNAKKAKIISIHPKGTYSLESSADEMILTISDPDAFWEQTKYLVIQTN